MTGDFRVGPWLVRPSLNSISQNGTSDRVERKVMEVLVCLAEHSGEAVPKEKLLQTVWPDTFVSDDVLKRSVSELRRVFGDDAHESRIIETIPKRGYRLVAPVELVNGSDRLVLALERIESQNEVRRAPRKFWIALCAIVGGLLFFGVLIGLNVAGLRDRIGLQSAAPSIHSLAVLPLASLSSDPAQEYFADGVTDALITDLAHISALRVVSRTTMMRYRKTDKPLPQIARELNVDGIVEGTVQRSGERVRITAQLIYGPGDQHLWAQSFERDVKDMLALQSAVASEIANEIQVKITPDEQVRLKSARPVNPKALDAYVEARYHLDQAGKLEYYKDKQEIQKEEFRKAVSYLDQAVKEDPGYIPPYVSYFDAVDATNISGLELLPVAKAALTKALELDERNVEAHLALARLLMQFEYDWPGAEQQYKRAIGLSPNSAEAHYQYSEYLENIGRNKEGDKERDLAQALDPAHDYSADAGVHRLGNTLDQDRQVLEERAPNDPFALGVLGKEYAVAGRYKESVEMWERCLALYGWHDQVNVLKRADAKHGPKFALEEWMRASEEYSRRRDDWPVVAMAFTYSSLGNKDRAFAWLDKAVAQRNWCIIYLKLDEVWNPVRSDPRFSDLLRRVGLPQ
ncbi:MAG TPA: winged helix-turn-helix domain-containing protein [Terriglobales bacterium]|nr:winged helix-turn-helix domain-containing protein [Terriglobales bacterium]